MIAWRVQKLLHQIRGALAAPSRNARTAVVIGRLLGAAFILCFVTGVYSHFLQDPLPWMVFPTRPTFLYQLTQGIHITAGILCFPLLFAKLYAIFPELFQTPPVRSFPHFLERASIALFVSTSIVQIVIGMLNTYQWYALFPFPFRQTHYALSFVVIGSLAIHIALKLPTIQKYWRRKDNVDEEGALVVHQEYEDELAPGADVPSRGLTGRLFRWIDDNPEPAPETTRRGFFVIVGLAGAAVVGLTAGQSFRVLDATNVFAPRKAGIGPNALPVNRTAKAAKVLETAVDAAWTLTLMNGAVTKSFTRAELQALPQYEVELPIACVEGWSQMAQWKGPRLRDLVASVEGAADKSIRAKSLEQKSNYATMDMPPEYVQDELTLVALELNGEELDLDHGYPARMIAPGRPGVLQTKWLSTIEVLA